MKMKILVTGKNGQLGKSIRKIISNNPQEHEFFFTGQSELDFSNQNSILNYFSNKKFDIVINCAAYTAVDKAEKEIKLASQVNHFALKQIAEILFKQNTKLIHISTDYVFDGRSNNPYKENDSPNPLNVYGQTKLSGEYALIKIMPTNAIIIRTSWLYSEYKGNFLDTMLKLGKERTELDIIDDQIGSPTFANDLVKAILTILKSRKFNDQNQATAIYHYSNEGQCSWYEFANCIFKFAKLKCKIKRITTDEYESDTIRPRNTVMSNDKIKKDFDLIIPNYQDSIKDCINLKKVNTSSVLE